MSQTVKGKASCIMATSGRAAMAARSCALFARQTYPHRELIIVADRGEIEPDPGWNGNVILIEVPPGTSVGTRRNLACHRASGEWILQWDDDDWRGEESIAKLVAPLNEGGADVSGFTGTPFFDFHSGIYWDTHNLLQNRFPHGIHPGTLAFRKSGWERGGYPAKTGGEDLGLLASLTENGAKVNAVDAAGGAHFIYIRHGSNTWDVKCGETNGSESWRQIPEREIPLAAADWIDEWKNRQRHSESGIVGVTLTSPRYRAMAEEAAQRFTWATGVTAYVRCEANDQCHLAKLELARDFSGTVVFFDADLWFLRKTDLTRYIDREPLLAVLDPGRFLPSEFPPFDCGVLDMDPARYFNTAFLIWNGRHVAAWEEARRIYHSGMFPNSQDIRPPVPGGSRLKDFGEQSYINAGVQHTQTSFEPLPTTFNYFPSATRNMPDYPRIPHPVACHAAGVGTDQKHERLKFWAQQWSEKKPA